MRTWDETIRFIRSDEKYSDLVAQAYLEEDLILNIKRFKSGEEYSETLDEIRNYQPDAHKILDIGCGNGVSCISFARDGFEVTAVEPDPSDTIGAGAIKLLKNYYNLDNLNIYESFAEDLSLPEGTFDVVYIRQAMHHANDLETFVSNCIRFLKPGGLFITVRDHVVYDEEDKELFLKNHPLHKFYGGENAFTLYEYKSAIDNGGANISKILRHYDSVINYFPMTKKEYFELPETKETIVLNHLVEKIGWLGKLKPVQALYKKYIGFNTGSIYDESAIPGRLYTFIAVKR